MEFINCEKMFSSGIGKEEIIFYQKDQHSHPLYHIVLFTEGNFHYIHKDKKIDFYPGVISVISPNESHVFGWFGELLKPTGLSQLTFQLLNTETDEPLTIPFNRLLERYSGLKIPDITWPKTLGKTSLNYMQKGIDNIIDLLNSGQNLDSLSIGITTIEIFKIIIKECYGIGNEDLNNLHQNKPEEKVKEYIESKFRENITISEISNIACLAPNYIIRKFKKNYNTTPINYQMELKINAAKTLLRSTGLSIKRIAHETGFNDIYYFSRQFKKITGQPPSQFRKDKITRKS